MRTTTNESPEMRRRRPTKRINVGTVPIGGGSPVSIQTMTTTLTHDTDATLHQIDRCVKAGADIVRVAVPEEEDAKALSTLVRRRRYQSSLTFISIIDMHLTRLTLKSQRSESIPATLVTKIGLRKFFQGQNPQASPSVSA